MEGWLEAKKGFAGLRSRSGRSSTSKLGRERSRPRSLVSVVRGEVFLNQTLIIIGGYILIMIRLWPLLPLPRSPTRGRRKRGCASVTSAAAARTR